VEADLGEGADTLVGAPTSVVVGGLAVLDQPGLQQGLEQPGLHRVVGVVLDGEALVAPAQVGDLQGDVTPRVPREVKRTLSALLLCLFAAGLSLTGII